MNFPQSVSPSKEMGDRTRQRKRSLTSAGIEPTTSEFDRPLLYRLSYETRREQVVGNYGGNCDSVNVSLVLAAAQHSFVPFITTLIYLVLFLVALCVFLLPRDL